MKVSGTLAQRELTSKTMEQDEIVFACSVDELSCIVGNLFTELDAPCDNITGERQLVICGTTHSGKHGTLVIQKDFCCFSGDKADLEAVRSKACLERKCRYGR